MSTIKVDTITDEAGSGAPDFPNGMTGNGSSLTGLATAAQGALADTSLQPALAGVTSVDAATAAAIEAAGIGFPSNSLVKTVTVDENDTASATSGTYTAATDGHLLIGVFAGGGSGGAATLSNDSTCSVFATGGGSGGYAYTYISVSAGDTFSYNLGAQAQTTFSGWLRGGHAFTGASGGPASLTGPNGLSISCTGGGGGGGSTFSSLTSSSLSGGTAGTATATGATAVDGAAAESLVNSVGTQVGASNSYFASAGAASTGFVVSYVSKNVFSITVPTENSLTYSEEVDQGTTYNMTPDGGNGFPALAVNVSAQSAIGNAGAYSGGGGAAAVMGYVNAHSFNAQGGVTGGAGAPPTVRFTLFQIV